MEAVTMFEEVHPDLILMDMKMPNLGGIDATRIIRELVPDVPIIALTAYAYEHDKASCPGSRLQRLPYQTLHSRSAEGNHQEMAG